MSDGAYLVRPDGRTVLFRDPAGLQKALSAGYRPEQPEEAQKREAADSPIQAGFEGALRGVTLGASDFLLKNLTPSEEESKRNETEMRLRKEANPTAAIGGEVAGTLAASLIPGTGPSVAAKAGGLAERLVGGGVAGTLARGATEGSIYGLGNVISEASLGDPQDTTEKISAVLGPAAFGAGLNALTHGVGKVGEAAITKAVGGKALKGMLDDVPEKLLAMQISSKKATRAGGLSHDGLMKTMRYALDNGLVAPTDDIQSFLSKVEAHKAEVGAGIQDAMGGEANALFDPERLAVRAEKDLLDKMRVNPGNQGDITHIDNFISTLRGDGRARTLGDVHEIQSQMKAQIGHAEPAASKTNKLAFRNLLRDEMLSQLEDRAAGSSDAYREAAGNYRHASNLERMGDEMLSRSDNNSPIAFRDMLFGAMGLMHGGPAALLGIGASKLARERGGFFLASMANKLADGGAVPAIAGALKGKIDSMLESTPELLGAFRNLLAEASGRGAEHLLATHIRLAQNDSMYLPTLGMDHETPEASDQYAAKAEGLGVLRNAVSDYDAQVSAAAGRFTGETPGKHPAVPTYTPSTKDFNSRLAKLEQVVRAPQVLDTSAMAHVAPQLAMLLQQQEVQKAQFLYDKAPKNPDFGRMEALGVGSWEPSKSALSNWYRYVRAVEQPNSVLHDLAAGRLPTPEATEAVQAIYPRLYAEMRSKVMERLAQWRTPLPYAKKQALAGLFGQQILGTNPMSLQLLQSVHSANMQPPQGATGGAKSDGRQNVSQAENMQTQAQRIENRGAR